MYLQSYCQAVPDICDELDKIVLAFLPENQTGETGEDPLRRFFFFFCSPCTKQAISQARD